MQMLAAGLTRRRWFVSCVVACVATGGGLSASTANERPNVLLAISDDQSYPHASAYGDPVVRTPAFDRVAREGVLFTAAFAPSPGCSPCRAALLTGRYPWQIAEAGTHNSSFPARYATYPDLLEAAGYFVGFTGKGWGPGNWEVSGRPRNPAGPAFNARKVDPPPPRGVNRIDYAANFKEFLAARPHGQPFCFWYGGKEPHRTFDRGIGRRHGKRLDDVVVPPFLPDTPEVRSDLLDYYFEIEWFDRHLGDMLAELDAIGELDRTIVIVTSDNGMAFPRAKANVYEYGIHMPLAIRWGDKVAGGRSVDDLVSFVDLTATLLDVCGVEHPGSYPLAGRSLRAILESNESGTLEPMRDAVFSGRERHSSSRYNNLGYPQRAIRTQKYLYIRNLTPDRWPAGDPQKIEDGQLGPPHGGYHDIDASPTLDVLVERRNDPAIERYFRLAVAKRPAIELYDIEHDPGCLTNLAHSATHREVLQDLDARLIQYLQDSGDPRLGDDPEIFESYPRFSRHRDFPAPEAGPATTR